jgi:hypothetical protein
MLRPDRYFDELHALLAQMPPGEIDMSAIEANEQRHGHQFYDPAETVHQWLLDQQRRAQTPGHPANPASHGPVRIGSRG